MHYCVKTAILIGPTEENCLYSAHCHYCTHACLHNNGFIAYQVQCGDNDARDLWTALTYLQMVGHIRWIKGVLGDVSEMTTQRSMGRGPMQVLTHSSQPVCCTSAEACSPYSRHLKKTLPSRIQWGSC